MVQAVFPSPAGFTEGRRHPFLTHTNGLAGGPDRGAMACPKRMELIVSLANLTLLTVGMKRFILHTPRATRRYW